MVFQSFVLIDPDEISLFLAKKAVMAASPSSQIIVFKNPEEAFEFLSAHKDPCCIIIENTVLNLEVKVLLSLSKVYAEKNFRIIVLSNAFQKKLLSVIPHLYHVRFTYKPINPKKLKEIIDDWS